MMSMASRIETNMRVGEDQWAESEALFNTIMGAGCGTLTKQKYDQILEVLLGWDAMTASERRELTNGNCNYWNKKYVVMKPVANEDAILVFRANAKRVIHQDNLFQSIRDVHTQSESALRMNYMYMSCL